MLPYPFLSVTAVVFSGLASTALAKPYAGFYPRNNDTTTAIASTGQGFVSASSPFMWSSSISQPSSSHGPSLNSGNLFSSIAPAGVVPPYPSSTGTAANTASRGTFFSGGYGSLPTGTGSPLNGIPPYPYPSATGYRASRGGSLPVGTGGYYPAGNGTLGDTNSTRTIHSTRFVTRKLAPCTINAIGANVYYWDTYRLDITQCVGKILGACTNQSTPAPYTLGAPATRTISTYTTPPPVLIPTSTSSLTVLISGYTNPTVTTTNYVYGTISFSKVTYVDEYTQVGSSTTEPITFYEFSYPPVSAPSDVLIPDMTENGWTYAYTATYPQPNVLYSVFEIESQYVAPGPKIATSTATFTASVPFFGPFTGSFSGNYSVPNATGPIEVDAPKYLAWAGAGDHVAKCAAGTYRGTPTVEVVLVTDAAAFATAAPAFAHISILGGLTPTTTEPSPTVLQLEQLGLSKMCSRLYQQLGQGGSGQGGPGQGGSQGTSNNGGSNGGSTQGSSNQGSSNQGSSNQGSSNQGSSNQGSSNQGSSNQGSSNQGSSNQGSSNQGGPQGTSNNGGSNGGSVQGGSNGASGPSSDSGSSHKVAPGGHQSGSNQGGSNINTGSSGAGAGNGQGGSNRQNGQGAQIGTGSGGGANGGQGGPGNSGSSGTPGGAPQSLETTVFNIPISLSGNTAIINGQTFVQTSGSHAITTTINNQPVVVSPSQVNIGGQIIPIPAAAAAPSPAGPPSITFGASIITANPSSQFIIAGQTLSPGSAIEVSGTKLSLGPSAASIVIGGSTVSLNAPGTTSAPSSPAFFFGGSTFTANPNAPIVIGGQTLFPGGPAITVSGTRLSLATSASQVVIGGATISLNTNTSPITAVPALTIGGQTITANPASQYVIAGQTLVPGGSAITVSGTRLSLAPSASQLVVGSSTIPLIALGALPTLTFGGQTLTANPSSQYVIDGQTLAPGGPAITISGTRISLGPSASALVVGSTTIPLSSGAGQITAYPTITIGSQTVTANSQGQYIIGGQTLTPGGVITVSGTPISLAPGVSDVVLGTSTEGLGGAIMGGFGTTAGATAGATGSIEGFKGEAATTRRSHLCVLLGAMVAVWMVS